MSENKNENKKSRGPLNKILLCVFALTFLVSTGMLIRELYVKQQQQALYEELAAGIEKSESSDIDASGDAENGDFSASGNLENETVGTESENTESEGTNEGSLEDALSDETSQKEIDWEALKKQNEDIYAWIYIPDTKINYPILQHPTEPSYYLKHNIDHSTGLPGCIYTQNYNSTDFTDPNTVIYGHNMKNKTMFGSLHNFEDNLFFEEHPYVYIYTPEKTLVYEIFAAYEYSDAHVLLNFDYETPESFELYLESVRSIKEMNSHQREETVVTSADKIITLSTCISGKDDKRWLVQAVLLNEE